MLKIKDMDSLLKIVASLVRNNYIVNINTVYQEYPRENYIDYYEVSYHLVEKVGDNYES